jgi:hypothetical protein
MRESPFRRLITFSVLNARLDNNYSGAKAIRRELAALQIHEGCKPVVFVQKVEKRS